MYLQENGAVGGSSILIVSFTRRDAFGNRFKTALEKKSGRGSK